MFFRHNIIGILWALFILVGAVIPNPELPNTPIVSSDKLFHALVFAFLVFQFTIGFSKQNSICRLKYGAWKIALAFGIVYGAIIELIQGTIVTYRTMDIMDLVANVAGCFIGALVFFLLFGKESKKNKIHELFR
jgi:glycopeptide antibiotics resistance protein